MSLPKTLFLSRGSNAVAWYRCALPGARARLRLGLLRPGEPPHTKLMWGRTQAPLTFADIADYDVVVVQQPRGVAWLKAIREWQAARRRRAVRDRRLGSAASARRTTTTSPASSTASVVDEMELCMRAADGVDLLDRVARRALRVGQPDHLRLPQRARPQALRADAAQARPRDDRLGRRHRARQRHAPVARARSPTCMRERPDARFVSIGQHFANALAKEFEPERAADRAVGAVRRLPRRDDADGHRARPGRQVELLPRQERPALARGRRAGDPARRRSGRVSGDRARRHRLPRVDRPPRSASCSIRSSTTASCASASAPPPRRTSSSTAARRSPPSSWAEVLREVAPRRPRRLT